MLLEPWGTERGQCVGKLGLGTYRPGRGADLGQEKDTVGTSLKNESAESSASLFVISWGRIQLARTGPESLLVALLANSLPRNSRPKISFYPFDYGISSSHHTDESS
jgi:hypothetical protein